MLRNADYYLLSGLVQKFNEAHPSVRVRLIGLNSADVATAVADGELEAGVVVLPIDAQGLQVTPWARDEVLYVSSDPERTRAPRTIADLGAATLVLYDAHAGWRDPTRKQLADRANVAGTRIEPAIEVEQVETALNLVAACRSGLRGAPAYRPIARPTVPRGDSATDRFVLRAPA